MKVLADSKLLNKSEIHRRWGHPSPRTIGKLVERGVLTPIRIGAYDYFSEAELLRYFADGKRLPSTARAS